LAVSRIADRALTPSCARARGSGSPCWPAGGNGALRAHDHSPPATIGELLIHPMDHAFIRWALPSSDQLHVHPV